MKRDEQSMSVVKYDLIIIGAGTVGFDGMRGPADKTRILYGKPFFGI
jgi:hypothetical protein